MSDPIAALREEILSAVYAAQCAIDAPEAVERIMEAVTASAAPVDRAAVRREAFERAIKVIEDRREDCGGGDYRVSDAVRDEWDEIELSLQALAEADGGEG